jgi:SAM-dependent methyltransferase
MKNKPTLEKRVKKLIKEKQGVKIDLGCGERKQGDDFIGVDYRKLDGVDVVWNLEEYPYPFPDECASLVVATHVLEHINPHAGVFIDMMNEVWRIMKIGGEFAFVVPYAGSPGYWQDPTHVNPISRNTLAYFDPLDPKIGNQLYSIYRPKPWKIKVVNFHQAGNLEAVLVKRRIDKSYGVLDE